MIPELMRKLTFTLGVLIVYRIGTFIPVIGVNVPLLVDHMKRLDAAGGLLGYLDIFSGGALQQATLFALGVGLAPQGEYHIPKPPHRDFLCTQEHYQ